MSTCNGTIFFMDSFVEEKDNRLMRPGGRDDSLSRGEEARRKLVRAGLEVFGRFGFEGATTRQIAERAEMNLSAITYHFGNKAGLYHAVVAAIADEMSLPLTPVVERIHEVLARGGLTSAEAQEWLLNILDALAQRVLDLSPQEASLIVPIWIREQIDPTPAFEVLYDRVLARMLQPCSALMGYVLSKPATDPECRVRVFALVGQVVVFRLVRLAVLRTLDWSDYDAENAAFVRKIIRQQMQSVLANAESLSE